MFIQTEATQSPPRLKFIPRRTVLGSGTMEFTPSLESSARSPLAANCFDVPGVTSVFSGPPTSSPVKQ